MNSSLQLAIIIVNYNTKDKLRECLVSIFNSTQNTNFEIWIVDNNSEDQSAEMVQTEFAQVRLIINETNLGFAKANNQAIKQVTSDFVLLLNPDTKVSDYVFDRTIEFLKKNNDVGMVTCRLVKSDGKLDLACRRSFPTVFDGFCRAVGLSRMFPRSRLLARYNLTFLDENQANKVDAINGAFMMVRKRAIDDVGLLDEDYFMYMEDIDWCFRFRKRGWNIWYLPRPEVLHYKGESGKINSSKMINEFFRSMELFCMKHYFGEKSAFSQKIIRIGIQTWKQFTLFRNTLRSNKRVSP